MPDFGLLFLWCFAGFAVLAHMKWGLPLGWSWRKPAPKQVAPPQPTAVVETGPYELRYKLGDMRLSWSFDSAGERDQFRIGFREGLEYQLEVLYRQGRLSVPHHMEWSPVEQPNRR